MINGKYPAQLIAMVSEALKAELKDESDRREVSISQVVREHIIRSKRLVHLTVDLDEPVVYPDAETARDAVEQMERNRLDAEEEDDDDVPTLAEHVAALGPDTDADEVDGHLTTLASGVQLIERPDLRVARRKPKGIT